MSKIWSNASRRDFLKMSAMAGAVGSGLFSLAGNASAADTLNFYGWSAGVGDVKTHVAAFEKKTGINVIYNNAPWAQYRDTMVTKFVGHAPLDVMYVSDSWLPEGADAGGI